MKGKIKIMKTRPELADDEIRSYMDFDKLLEIHKTISVRHRFRSARYFLIVGSVVSIGLVSWFLLSRDKSVETQSVLKTGNGKVLDLKKNTTPVVDSASGTGPLKRENKVRNPVGEKKEINEVRKAIPGISKSEEKKSITTDQDRERPAVDLVYVQAAPINGYPELYEYFNRELRYPEEAMKDSIRGEVVAIFTINAKGLPQNISIEHSLGALFDKEVIRLISNMPAWKPATYNSKPVASKLSLPLTFQIKKIHSQK